MGAPGLAFETWDPRSESPMDTHDVTTGYTRAPSGNEEDVPHSS
jgi:hypothetical protein